MFLYTGYTQKNGAVSKVNEKFISPHGHNIHCQQWQLSKFLMRYQQFTSHAYCGAAGLVSKMVSQQEKGFFVLCFEVSRSVITVQREFCQAVKWIFLAKVRKLGSSGGLLSTSHLP